MCERSIAEKSMTALCVCSAVFLAPNPLAPVVPAESETAAAAAALSEASVLALAHAHAKPALTHLLFTFSVYFSP